MSKGSIDEEVRVHYDSQPFDNFTEDSLTHLERNSLLGRTLALHSLENTVQLDIGCGTGKVFALMERIGRGTLSGVDFSSGSIRKLRQRWPQVAVVNGSVLALPFQDSVASLITLVGVIHHTSDPRGAFGECVRLLKTGAYLYVSFYSRNHSYRWAYQNVGALFRRMKSNRVGAILLARVIIPMWYVYYCYCRSLLVRGSISSLSLPRSVNLFYDRYLVPQASFHTQEELLQWGMSWGLEVVETAEHEAMTEMLFRSCADAAEG